MFFVFLKKFFLLFFFAVFFCGIVFAGPAVTSSTHLDPAQWYKSDAPSFSVENGGAGYSFAFDALPDTVPDEVSDTSGSEISFSNKASGVFYFHVRMKKGGVWSDTAHFKVQIDHSGPTTATDLKAEFVTGGINLSWADGTDVGSGIGGYKIYRSFVKDFDIREDFYEIISQKVEGTSYLDETVSEGKTFHYRLQSIDRLGTIGGLSKSFFVRVPTSCDFVPQIVSSLVDGNLSFVIDSSPYIMRYASLVLKPEFGDEIAVFSNQPEADRLIGNVVVSNLADQKILVEFGVKDESNDDCSVSETFFLDRIVPAGEWLVPLPNGVLDGAATLKVKASDGGTNASGISLVEFFFVDGAEKKIGDGISGDGGEYYFDFNTSFVPVGRFEFVAKIFDRAGNFVEKKVLATVKNTALASADANAAISAAKEKKAEAVGVAGQLKLLGVVSPEFSGLMQKGNAFLAHAEEVFSGGANFGRVKADANSASDSFEQAASLVFIEKSDTLQRVFSDEETASAFGVVGLSPALWGMASKNLETFAPVRKVEIYKVIDGNGSFYRVVFAVTLTGGGNSGNVVALEVVPKEIAAFGGELSSGLDFELLNADPVLKFDFDLNQSKKASYFLVKNFSKAELDEFTKENPLKLFSTLPIVLDAGTRVDAGTVVKPVDLFAEFGKLTVSYDSTTLALLAVGGVVLLLVVLGIIAFFVVLFFILQKRG